VCPDGSIFIVQRPEAIPCANAKQVDPGDVPPLKPELLPRPYAWEVFNQQQNPNNPYNLIDAARQVRETRAMEAAATAPGESAASTGAARDDREERAAAASRPASPLPAVGERPHATRLRSRTERRGARSGLIVELTACVRDLRSRRWRRAPTPGARGAVDGFRGASTHGASEAATSRASHVSRPARGARSFHPNFTFVQGHQAFHPDPSDPTQLGVIRGDLGDLAPEAVVLGYVVLPDQVELAKPLDIYWDDRQLGNAAAPTDPACDR
jgi:hypothetical protein